MHRILPSGTLGSITQNVRPVRAPGERAMKFSIIYEAQMVDVSRENEAKVFNDMAEQGSSKLSKSFQRRSA